MPKPVLFIGSSTEALDVARTIEELLTNDAKINLWTSDIFDLGATTIESLFDQLEACDYAILVITPDDLIVSRDQKQFGPRDNLIFEIGLFMGRLGRKKTFLVCDSESKPKIPSDLSGLTYTVYSRTRFQENPKAALGPAVNQIRRKLRTYADTKEIDFLRAYITFIQPSTSLADSYSQILSNHLNFIKSEVAKLEVQGDWATLLEVKQRLREYFEYSGHYLQGVEFGRLYFRALSELGKSTEAIWTRVKHVGYLLILADQHTAGRTEILDAVSASSSLPTVSQDETNQLLFYCYRYLGISFQRDDVFGDVQKAKHYFEQAEMCVNLLPPGTSIRNELYARLLGNYGNLAFDGRDYSMALEYYKRSLDIFVELNDIEHIGTTNLKIARTIITNTNDISQAISYLEIAEAVFIRIGWIGAQASVFEQYARLNLCLVEKNDDSNERVYHLNQAVSAAKKSKTLFQRIGNHNRAGRIEELLERISNIS